MNTLTLKRDAWDASLLVKYAFIAVAMIGSFFFMTEPAYAQAFGQVTDRITGQTQQAFDAGKTVLYVAAAVSLLVGVAPMLWGQVKVKWIVSCLVAAVLFAIIPSMIDAFAGGSVTGIQG